MALVGEATEIDGLHHIFTTSVWPQAEIGQPKNQYERSLFRKEERTGNNRVRVSMQPVLRSTTKVVPLARIEHCCDGDVPTLDVVRAVITMPSFSWARREKLDVCVIPGPDASNRRLIFTKIDYKKCETKDCSQPRLLLVNPHPHFMATYQTHPSESSSNFSLASLTALSHVSVNFVTISAAYEGRGLPKPVRREAKRQNRRQAKFPCFEVASSGALTFPHCLGGLSQRKRRTVRCDLTRIP
jgi:hypothetical protein